MARGDKQYRRGKAGAQLTTVTKGEYTVVQASNHHVHLYKNGVMVMHASCTHKKTEEELLRHIDTFEQLRQHAFEGYDDEGEEDET